MPGTDGVAMLQRVLEIDPDIPVILVTGHGDVELAVSCIKDGAYDFLEKPCEPARLVATVRRAMERRCLTLENRALREQVTSTNVIEARLPGRSDVMATLRDRVSAIAATDADILISGPTGTGKEVAARDPSCERKIRSPFVHINCAALPAALIESELFGSEAGHSPDQSGRGLGGWSMRAKVCCVWMRSTPYLCHCKPSFWTSWTSDKSHDLVK